MKTIRGARFVSVVRLMVLGCICAAPSAVLSQGDGSRQIVLDEFTRARPATSAKAQPPAKGPRRRPPAVAKAPRYVRKTPSVIATLEPGSPTMDIGVTIWRLRPSAGIDGGARVLVQESAQTTEWTPQRIEADTPLRVGERVRLTIESPRAGYVYVIDREQYADGTFGDARLIFPTKRTRDGNNEVKAGQLIYIPPPPRSFRVRPGQAEKPPVAEILTLLVSSQPLIDHAQLGDRAMLLTREQVEGWEKQWGMQPTKFELTGGAGRTMTDKEQAAGKDDTELNQDDPAPQTIYRVAIKPEAPLLVTVRLPYGYASSKQ